MNTFFKAGQLLIIVMIFFSCKTPTVKDLAKENLIPKPTKLFATGSSFELTGKTTIYVEENDETIRPIGNYLADLIKPATGFETEVQGVKNADFKKGIYLALVEKNKDLGEEGYILSIDEKKIVLEAYQLAGLFRGVQTIRQLLPARIESKDLQMGSWEIASGTIEDAPDYGYRGAMLDVVRHFFDVTDVKRFIDLIAAYKMNVLHLHLTDDQGWRIEIKSWPNLTKHGGSTQVDGGKGGFYTQEEYTELVKYAQDRFITIIPEIDMPGHTNAALASYAELNADGKARDLYTGTNVGFSTLDANKEITYKFIDDVIRELSAMTPGPFIHIGGDESHVTAKDDYIEFIDKVQDIVNAHGKQMIGWADIAAGSLKENSLAQFWQIKPDNALKAVNQNVKVIMSPAAKAYMDIQYNKLCPLGLNWSGYIEVDKAYNWTLESNVEGISKEDIVGIEAPLWTETIETMDDIEFMVFPRLPGYAELGWSSDVNKSWDEYKVRLAKQKTRFEFMDINYYKSALVPWVDEVITEK
ncbi:beta-N-acetylhexosaminidase [Labilibaculum sp. DW002]|uniref:beta-N-acetylhexosaminidase n=1 Tax=Paralabilibaculum antarcticum TaxID=2912572 RepID=A0ABT5VQZ6_9BACT|nr:beta-N-acetylhexosaminidase [Labilibaculum sp. DW002]MDE5416714.1 beta-N-acetylhexosaminidase [Labilibaculum sp. DW002]